ncbi:phosphatidate cytidylyltransferase [Thiohalorhabdus sp. Cl-TMA]|uniref:Phosphatidate cytidylyltransferase n=1 Tax=Thiohalorhabdus methylotrophus TaxID=3242694 RepID=A0ABV4TYV5_9GAMM
MNKPTRSQAIRSRTLTALVLIALILAGLFYLPPQGILALGVALALVGGLEWASLIHIHGRGRYLYAALMGGATYILTLLDPVGVALGAGLWWLLVAAEVPVFRPQTDEPVYRSPNALAGLVTLPPAMALLVHLVQTDPWQGLAVLVVIWTADIGAYAVGKAWGNRKLAPHISPGKSWEGLVGGMALAAAAGGLLAWKSPLAGPAPGLLAGVAVLVALIGQVGDLLESMFKRRAGMKDSGQWLPGHGGLLDRIDSLTAGVPVFALCLWGLGV